MDLLNNILFSSRFKKNIYFVAVFCAFALVVETYLRLIVYSNPYLVYPPGQVTINRDVITGVYLKGTAHFSTNSLGLRGDELRPEYSPRILVVGSSTSVGWALDDKETWPYFLQQQMRERGENAWLAIGSRTGNRIVENYLQIESLLERIRNVDLVLLMVGDIDMLLRLSERNQYEANYLNNPEQMEKARQNAFGWIRGPFGFKELATLFWISQSSKNVDSQNIPIGGDLSAFRLFRKQAEKIVDDLPDLKVGLDEFEYYLKKIVNRVRASGSQVVFLTQPVFWTENMGEEEQKLPWMGFIADEQKAFPWGLKYKEYYSFPALVKASEFYRKRLLLVARNLKVDVVDINSSIPKTSEYFLDDAHVSPEGSKHIAWKVDHFLRGKELFNRLKTEDRN